MDCSFCKLPIGTAYIRLLNHWFHMLCFTYWCERTHDNEVRRLEKEHVHFPDPMD